MESSYWWIIFNLSPLPTCLPLCLLPPVVSGCPNSPFHCFPLPHVSSATQSLRFLSRFLPSPLPSLKVSPPCLLPTPACHYLCSVPAGSVTAAVWGVGQETQSMAAAHLVAAAWIWHFCSIAAMDWAALCLIVRRGAPPSHVKSSLQIE